MPFYPFQGILDHDRCKHPSLLIRGGPVCTEAVGPMGIISLDPLAAGDLRPGGWLQNLFTGLCARLPSYMFVTSSVCSRLPGAGRQSECWYFSCLCRKDLHIGRKAAGVGSNPRRLRTGAGDLGSGWKHWHLHARWVAVPTGSSGCLCSSPWDGEDPIEALG